MKMGKIQGEQKLDQVGEITTVHLHPQILVAPHFFQPRSVFSKLPGKGPLPHMLHQFLRHPVSRKDLSGKAIQKDHAITFFSAREARRRSNKATA